MIFDKEDILFFVKVWEWIPMIHQLWKAQNTRVNTWHLSRTTPTPKGTLISYYTNNLRLREKLTFYKQR